MRETRIMNNLNCKTQAHARVCEEKLEEKKTPIELILRLKGPSLKDYVRRVGRHIKMIFSRMIHHSIKVLVLHVHLVK